MTVRPGGAVVVDVRRAHLYEVGLGEGDAVGGAHRAAEQFGGGGGGGSDGRREGREQRVDDGEGGLEFDTMTILFTKSNKCKLIPIFVGSYPEISLEAVDVPLCDEVVEAGDEDHGLEDMVEHAVQVQRGEGVTALQ